MTIEAMKQALGLICSARLCEVNSMSSRQEMLRLMIEATDTLRAAIEQAEKQEPVAWMWADGTITTDPDRADGTWTPLYIAPRQWQGLTKDEVDEWELPDRPTVFEFAQFVESKLKEKNA